jgi:hypothetical protein
MGNQPVPRQMSMQHKLALGLLPASAVATVSASGTYQLAPMELVPAGATQLLRVPKPGGGNYFVEYRQPIGAFDGQSPTIGGVLIRTESPDLSNPNPTIQGDSDTALVDMHPDPGFPTTQWANAAMNAGEEFNDALRGIVIRSGVQNASGATLAITLPLDTQPPSSPDSLSAVESGTTVSLQWTAATDDRGRRPSTSPIPQPRRVRPWSTACRRSMSRATSDRRRAPVWRSPTRSRRALRRTSPPG